jgi:predicted SPOUT superfamily RNA methylase MTH1
MNFIPDQGVRTVRTEEAVYAVLSILNLIVSKRSA